MTWVSVKERLPDKVNPDGSVDLLVCDSFGYRRIAFFDFEESEWLDYAECPVWGVTHWWDEPLPEPPETGGGGRG